MLEKKTIQSMWETIVATHFKRQQNIERWRKQMFADAFERTPVWEGGSTIQLPITHWIVNLIADRLVLSQFALKPLIRIKPMRLEETPTMQALEALLAHYYQYGKRKAIANAITDALLLGAGVVRIVWKTKKIKWGQTKVIRYPATEYIPLENFYLFSPFADLEEQGAVAHAYWKRRGEFNEEERKKLMAGEQPFQIEGQEIYLNENTDDNDSVYLVDIFYRDGEDWRIATYVPQNNLILKDEPYRFPVSFLPFFMLRFYEHGYGYGLAPLLEPFEEELSTLHNQRIDNNTLINLPVFKVLSTSPAKDVDRWFAGAKIVVDTPEDITPLTQPERITPLQDEQQLFEYIKLISGVSELLSGSPLRGERTAYEIEAMLAEGSVRFRRYVLQVVDWLITQAKLELVLLKAFGKGIEEMMERMGYIGNPLDLLSYDDIMHLQFEGNTTLTNKEIERQRWVLLRNLLANDPLIKPEGWYELLRQILTAFDVDYRSILGEKQVQQPIMLTPPATATPEQLPQAAGGMNIPPELLTVLGSILPLEGSMTEQGNE